MSPCRKLLRSPVVFSQTASSASWASKYRCALNKRIPSANSFSMAVLPTWHWLFVVLVGSGGRWRERALPRLGVGSQPAARLVPEDPIQPLAGHVVGQVEVHLHGRHGPRARCTLERIKRWVHLKNRLFRFHSRIGGKVR